MREPSHKLKIEFLKVNRRGQITIPRAYREILNPHDYGQIRAVWDGKDLILESPPDWLTPKITLVKKPAKEGSRG